jgi:RimJ/RimL family protein N-acetyltransferase
MQFSTQPILENDHIKLQPLQADDFESLYAVASDPKIWEQHPNKDRWKREVFQSFFEGALESKGAYKIINKTTGEIAGSTRIYGYNEQESSIYIGYTFYATKFWGKGINLAVKAMMLDYLFQFVETVRFQIGAVNTRSQIAIGRLGATKIGEEEVAYFGEAPKLNYLYKIEKAEWLAKQKTIQNL